MEDIDLGSEETDLTHCCVTNLFGKHVQVTCPLGLSLLNFVMNDTYLEAMSYSCRACINDARCHRSVP